MKIPPKPNNHRVNWTFILLAVGVESLSSSCEKILIFPNSGGLVPEYSIGHLREIQYKDYQIVYAVRPKLCPVVFFH